MSAVRSVELLSQTMSSDSQPKAANAARAEFIWARVSPSNRSSLNAGMRIEIFNAPSVGGTLRWIQSSFRFSFPAGSAGILAGEFLSPTWEHAGKDAGAPREARQ